MVIKEVDFGMEMGIDLNKKDFIKLIRTNNNLDVIINGVSDLKESKFSDGNYIFIDFQIAEPVEYQGQDLEGSVIGVTYPLQYNKFLENSEDGAFYVSPKSKLYPLLKKGLEVKGQRINKAITCEIEDIKYFLEDLSLTVYVNDDFNYPVIAPIGE